MNSKEKLSQPSIEMPNQILTHVPTYIVDSFTTEKFKGNPAGVCMLEKALNNQQMLNIANELGFSETAFVLFDNQAEIQPIRFFSPLQEIDLCGHATLATAKILFNNELATDTIHFKNIDGVDLIVKQDKDTDKLLMEFPAYQVEQIKETEILQSMSKALGIDLEEVLYFGYNKEIHSFVIEISDSHQLVQLVPDFDKLVASCTDIHGVAVTARSKQSRYDFESRYFWPWVGTNEDPVTGAIHTFLSTYWGEKLNKTKMMALQCSLRGGSMQVELTDNNTVILTGEAQIILEGMIKL